MNFPERSGEQGASGVDSIQPDQRDLREAGGSRINAEAAAKEAADLAIIEAEKHKAEIETPRGKPMNMVDERGIPVIDDDNFTHISSHVDESIVKKIQRGEFVELSKLLKKSKYASGLADEPDKYRLEIVKKDGHTYYAPSEVDSDQKNNQYS